MSCPCQKLKAVLCLLDGTSRSGVCQSWPFPWELDRGSPACCHVRSVQMFWLQFTGWGQLGLCFLWWHKAQNFPFCQHSSGHWLSVTYLQDTVLVWVYRRMQSSFTQVPAFPLSQLPLLCLRKVLNQVFLHFGEVAAGLSWVLDKLTPTPFACQISTIWLTF